MGGGAYVIMFFVCLYVLFLDLKMTQSRAGKLEIRQNIRKQFIPFFYGVYFVCQWVECLVYVYIVCYENKRASA